MLSYVEFIECTIINMCMSVFRVHNTYYIIVHNIIVSMNTLYNGYSYKYIEYQLCIAQSSN